MTGSEIRQMGHAAEWTDAFVEEHKLYAFRNLSAEDRAWLADHADYLDDRAYTEEQRADLAWERVYWQVASLPVAVLHDIIENDLMRANHELWMDGRACMYARVMTEFARGMEAFTEDRKADAVRHAQCIVHMVEATKYLTHPRQG